MRTAVLFSGQPRAVAECVESMKLHLIDKLPNPDIYIYTSQSFPEHVIETLKPCQYIVEEQFKHRDMERAIGEFYHSQCHLNPYIQQIYGIKKVWELKEAFQVAHNLPKYDYVVRERPDHLWFSSFSLEMAGVGGNKFSTLSGTSPEPYCMIQEFGIGSEEVMKKYCGLYDWLLEHGQKRLKQGHPLCELDPGGKFNSDSILSMYLLDEMKIEHVAPVYPDGVRWVYDLYRIIHLHKDGQYKYG
jgi:hypothetical protein